MLERNGKTVILEVDRFQIKLLKYHNSKHTGDRAHPAISHCTCRHLLLKCRVASNICHWRKVKSKWFKNHIFGFSNIAFIIPSHIIIMPYFTLLMLDIFNTIRVSNSLDPDHARHFVGPDLGSNCLQRLSPDSKSG